MKKMMIGLAAAAFAVAACGAGVETWRATELTFEAGADYDKTGADAVTFDAVFTHASGEKVSRPGFWDGGKTSRPRSPDAGAGLPPAAATPRWMARPARWRRSRTRAASRSTSVAS